MHTHYDGTRTRDELIHRTNSGTHRRYHTILLACEGFLNKPLYKRSLIHPLPATPSQLSSYHPSDNSSDWDSGESEVEAPPPVEVEAPPPGQVEAPSQEQGEAPPPVAPPPPPLLHSDSVLFLLESDGEYEPVDTHTVPPKQTLITNYTTTTPPMVKSGKGQLTKQTQSGAELVINQPAEGSGLMKNQSQGGKGQLKKQTQGSAKLVTPEDEEDPGLIIMQTQDGKGLVTNQSEDEPGLMIRQTQGGKGLLTKQSEDGPGLIIKQTQAVARVAPKQPHGPNKRPRELDEWWQANLESRFAPSSSKRDDLLKSPQYILLQQLSKDHPQGAYLEEATQDILRVGKYPEGDHNVAVNKIADRMFHLKQQAEEDEYGGYEGNDPISNNDGYGYSEDYAPPANQSKDWEQTDPDDHMQREDEDWGTPVGMFHEQVNTLSSNKHKAYQKALTSLDKVTPNTRARRLEDYLTDVHFHAQLTYGHDAWETNPISLKAIVLTTFNHELRRQFLTKNAYESTTWTSLKTWLKASTDQTPDDIKLQAITKLRLNQHSQGKKTLAEYNNQFTTLLQNAMMDTPEHTSWAIQTYIAGLNTHISSQLIMNPVTNQHWLTLDEVKQCAYRLNYHNHQAKSFPSLAALQTPPPAPSRGRGGPPSRGRSLTRGRGSGGRGRSPGSRGGYGQGGRGRYDQDGRGGYGQGGRGRHDQDGRSGYGPRGRGDHNREGRGGYQGDRDGGPKQGSHPSQINRSLWIFQEKYLIQKGVCPSCFGDLNQCSREGSQCPLTHRPTEIWDVSASKLKGCTLTKLQRNGIYPENA